MPFENPRGRRQRFALSCRTRFLTYREFSPCNGFLNDCLGEGVALAAPATPAFKPFAGRGGQRRLQGSRLRLVFPLLFRLYWRDSAPDSRQVACLFN
jgi:hypothetical protein